MNITPVTSIEEVESVLAAGEAMVRVSGPVDVINGPSRMTLCQGAEVNVRTLARIGARLEWQ